MRVMILGSKGMLGTALKEEFKDCEVFCFDKDELDITNTVETREKVEEIKPGVIINATAINAVDLIETENKMYELAKEINGLVVGRLAEICKELNIVLVHYSSDYVFGSTSSPQVNGDSIDGYVEEAPVDPVDKYGETKVLGEKLLKINGEKYYLIRLSRLFGPAGESEMAKNSFVDIMLDLVLNKGNPSINTQGEVKLDLVDDEKTSPTYSKDLAKLTRYILETKQPFGIYHGANTGSCTWYEFAKEIFALKNLNVECNPVPATKFSRPAQRPKFSELVNTKLPLQRAWQIALKEYLS